MKPLADRLKDKEEAAKKERLKRSGKAKFMQFGIPLFGHPYVSTEGDELFLKQKAERLDVILRTEVPYQFREQLVKAMARPQDEALKDLEHYSVPSPSSNAFDDYEWDFSNIFTDIQEETPHITSMFSDPVLSRSETEVATGPSAPPAVPPGA